MKAMLIILLLRFATTAWAQDGLQHPQRIDSISFCSIKFKVPKECETQYNAPNYIVSEGNNTTLIKCGNISLQWVYPDKDSLEVKGERMVAKNELKNNQIKPYVLDKEVKGFKTLHDFTV